MAKKKHWYPSGRQNQLNFVKRWISVFTEPAAEGGTQKKWQAWGIPQETFTVFGTAYSDALAAFDALVTSGTRGGPLNAAALAAFTEMEKRTRDLKRRYIYIPPLNSADFDALAVPEKDTVRTPEPVPARGVKINIRYGELHEIILELSPAGPAGEDVSEFTFNIRFGILSPDGKIPERSSQAVNYMTKIPVIPQDLPGQYNRKRKNENFPLTVLEAGKTAYFCVCYQNSKGETGPWSGIVTAVIT